MISRPRVDSMAGVALKTIGVAIANHMEADVLQRVKNLKPLSPRKWTRRTSTTASPGAIGLRHGLAGVSYTPIDFGDEPQDWIDYYAAWVEGKERRNGQQG